MRGIVTMNYRAALTEQRATTLRMMVQQMLAESKGMVRKNMLTSRTKAKK